jgi:hypothetical protein
VSRSYVFVVATADVISMRCDCCGGCVGIKLPVSVDELCAVLDAFLERHIECPTKEAAS